MEQIKERPEQSEAFPRTGLFRRTENVLSYVILSLLSLLPVAEVIVRKVFRTGIPAYTDYTIHLVLWITFIGGMITSRERRHLALAAGLEALKEPIREKVRVINSFLAVMMTTAFFWSSLSFVIIGFTQSGRVGLIPIQLVGAIMPLGFLVMAVRFLLPVTPGGGRRFIASIGFLAGTFIGLSAVINIIYTFFFNVPMFVDTLLMFSYDAMYAAAIPLIILLALSAALGNPLFVVLGGVGFLLFARISAPLEIIANESYTMLISKAIPAIPLFTLAGFLLSESNAGKRLVNLFQAFFGWMPGGLAIAAIVVCTFFTTFTGASGVTILALGALLYYVLVRSGKYKGGFSTGLLTASGSIGLLFPPSLPIIIYGVSAQINVKHMFLGGILPGLLMVLALVGMGIFHAKRSKVERIPFEPRVAGRALRESVWEVLIPVIILAVYFGGLTTLVETGAIAVVYTFLVVVVLKRDLRLADLPRVFLKCIPIIGGVLVILAMARGLSYYLIDAQIPMRLTEWVQANIQSKYVFLILLNLALLLTGCIMDIFSAIMVVVPLILPLGSLFGIHPIHLGAIFLANLQLGYLTPPVGLNLFLASYRFEKPLWDISKQVIPFFGFLLLTVLLITYVPWFSLALLGGG